MICHKDIFRIRCQPFNFLLLAKFPDNLRLPYEEISILDIIGTRLFKNLRIQSFAVGTKH